jgi:hypothetical protein
MFLSCIRCVHAFFSLLPVSPSSREVVFGQFSNTAGHFFVSSLCRQNAGSTYPWMQGRAKTKSSWLSLFSIHVIIHVSIHPSIYLSNNLSVCLSIYWAFNLSVRLSISLSIHPSFYLSLSIYRMSKCPSAALDSRQVIETGLPKSTESQAAGKRSVDSDMGNLMLTPAESWAVTWASGSDWVWG